MHSTYWLGIYTYSLYQAIRKNKGALLDCGRYSKVYYSITAVIGAITRLWTLF